MSISIHNPCIENWAWDTEKSGQEVMSYVKIKIEFLNSGDEPLHGKDILERKEDLSTTSDNFDFLETVQNKTRSTSLPAVLNKNMANGEWSQKLTSPLSLSAIRDRFHTKHHSVREESFLKAEGIGGKDKQQAEAELCQAQVS